VWDDLGPRRRASLRRAARVVALSRFTAGQVAAVQHVPEGRLSVIHPAVDPLLLREANAHVDPPRAGASVTLLTIARLAARERYKGCDAVIEALPAVLAEAKTARYVIAGEGDDLPRLRALAEERGVGAAVTFAGRTQRDALPGFYRACDIFVMPSVAEQRAGGWTGEGFGIVYIEASAFGVPVVAGNGGGAPEAVQDGVTGLVVDGRDPDAVAGVLLRLARDAALRRRMGDAGRRWVAERFTFDRFAREVSAVIGEAAAGRG
jgi:phosphatidylinositol alpha-1,6-mannosyltransferase